MRWSHSQASMPPGLRKSASVSASPGSEPSSRPLAASWHHCGQSSSASRGATVTALIGSSAQRAPRATFSVSFSCSTSSVTSPPPPWTRACGTQASRKKPRGSIVGSLRRAAEVKGARQSGQTGPGGSGMRASRRSRQCRMRSAASSCTCSEQSKQQKCAHALSPRAPRNTPGPRWSGSKQTPHSDGSSAGPHSSERIGGPGALSDHCDERTRHCASSASRTISCRPCSRQVRIAASMFSMPSVRPRIARARAAWLVRSA
mmetsp:Transcript_76075/g.195978  ORF Transcript_76075/g.195978 Transcript_76075/m.195978 type:complete len:260 (-) Transcript_76075:263-1042(-)